MLLAIDVGNTNTVVGIFRNQKIVNVWRIASTHARTIDEYWITVKLFCEDAGIRTDKLSGVIISSVVPQLTYNFRMMSRRYLSIEPIVVNHELNLGLELLVDEPETVGADRICNLVAGKAYYPLPQIIVDLGTATTFDVLDTAGNYLGGAIAPGLITGASELTQKAAQLYKFKISAPDHIIGKTTTEHMQSGIFVGHIAMIEGLCQRIQAEMNAESVRIIATGGYAEELGSHSTLIQHVNNNLTLEGLRILYERNR